MNLLKNDSAAIKKLPAKYMGKVLVHLECSKPEKERLFYRCAFHRADKADCNLQTATREDSYL